MDSVGTHPRNGVLNKRKEKKITKTRPVDFVGIIHLSSASCVCVCVCRYQSGAPRERQDRRSQESNDGFG